MRDERAPSCGNCVHWQGVAGHRECRRYAVLTERDKRSGLERGDILPVEAELLTMVEQYEYLRPRAHFVCEQWRSADNETLLDPARFPPESHRYRLEQNKLIDKETTNYAAALQQAYIDAWAPVPGPRHKRQRVRQTLLSPVENDGNGNALWLEATA